MTLVDIDDTVKATYGYAKQGAGYGYTKVKGLNALIGIVSTPVSAPVIAATRLREGRPTPPAALPGWSPTPSPPHNGAARPDWSWSVPIRRSSTPMWSPRSVDPVPGSPSPPATTRRCSPRSAASPNRPGPRSDIRKRSGTRLRNVGLRRRGRRNRLHRVHLAPPRPQVSARLIVRRVRRLNTTPPARTSCSRLPLPCGLHEHPAADGPGRTLPPRARHRRASHRRLETSPLAHLPSGLFTANGAWLVCAAMAFNLTRASGCLASPFHAKATTGTVRAQLITVPARIATSARRIVLHLPPTGPGKRLAGTIHHGCADHPPRPDHPAPRRNRRQVEKPDRPATPTRPPRQPTDQDQLRPARNSSVDPGSDWRCGRSWLRRATQATSGWRAATSGPVPADRSRRGVDRGRRGGPRPGPPGCALARGRGG